MTEKVRYECWQFFHSITDRKMSLEDLLDPLEKICSDFGGFGCMVNCNDESRGGIGYTVGKAGSDMVFVELYVDLVPNRFAPCRKAIVTTVEGRGHPELLAALHSFYNGTPGYEGMPEAWIVEREVKSK